MVKSDKSVKWNKVIIKVDKIEVLSRIYKDLTLRVAIPIKAAPKPDKNVYVSRIHGSDSKQFFILLFRENANIVDKKFVITLLG